jgi:alkylation response protein AidB-like acyl-CoA dehydrogenase
MDFNFSPEEESFRREIREFVKRELPPDRWLSYQGEEYCGENWPLTRKIALKLGEKRWLGLRWPKKFGGRETTLYKELVFREEAAYWAIPGTVMGVGGTSWVGPCLLQVGTESQKEKFLPPLAAGHEFWCTGYSEPDAGSDLASLTTQADFQNGTYRVQGKKIWVSAAHIADWCWLLVRTNSDLPKHKGLSLLMVDMNSPGITVRPIMTITGSSSFSEIFFDDVHVPVENRVGEENQGWEIIGSALNLERAWPPARATGGAQRVLDELVRFCREKKAALRPALRHQLAQAALDVEVSRLLAYRVAFLLDRGRRIRHEASAAKVYGSELLERIAALGMKMLGPYGQLEPDSPHAPIQGWVEHLYLVSRGLTLAAGSSEIQRSIIATRGLGLPRK